MITRRELAAGTVAIAITGSASPSFAQDHTGLTDTSVKVGVLGSLTGVQAVFGQGNLSGAQMVFDEVNAAGGIHGRRIEIVSVDDESAPARSIAGFRRLVDDERVFAVFGPSASAIGQAMEPTLRAGQPNPTRTTSSAQVRSMTGYRAWRSQISYWIGWPGRRWPLRSRLTNTVAVEGKP